MKSFCKYCGEDYCTTCKPIKWDKALLILSIPILTLVMVLTYFIFF